MNLEKETEIRQEIAEKLSIYIPANTAKFGAFMSKSTKNRLENIKNYEEIIAFDYSGNVSAWASQSKITLPIGATNAFDIISKFPNAGTDKNHKNYTEKTLIENDNTFEDYINHLILIKADILTYFNDLLLHETMHFCGSGGSNVRRIGAFKEGLNEYLTRIVAKENGFQTSGCGYPKEIKVVIAMEQILGSNVLTQMAFLNSFEEIRDYLKMSVGNEKAKLFCKVTLEMEQEFSDKYFSNMKEFIGFNGAINKAKAYNNIDYSKTLSFIDEYKSNCEMQ